MDDNEIKQLEQVIADAAGDPLVSEIPPDLTISDFCLDSVKKMMTSGGAPRSSFHVMHGGSVYYIDMVIRAIAPPYEARDPRLNEKQWFGQRET